MSALVFCCWRRRTSSSCRSLSARSRSPTIGAELTGRRAERVGRLQRMPAQHADAATPAAGDLDVELPDDRPPRNFHLILLRDDRCGKRAAAALGARLRQRRGMHFLDVSRHGAMPVNAMLVPGIASGRLRRPGLWPFEQGAACRLPLRVRSSSSDSGLASLASSSSTRLCRRLQLGHSVCSSASLMMSGHSLTSPRCASPVFGAVNKYVRRCRRSKS